MDKPSNNTNESINELLTQMLAQEDAGNPNDTKNLYKEKPKGNIHSLLTKLLAQQKATNCLLALILLLLIIKLVFFGM